MDKYKQEISELNIEELLSGNKITYNEVKFQLNKNPEYGNCLYCTGIDIDTIINTYDELIKNGIDIGLIRLNISSFKNKYDIDYTPLKKCPNVGIAYGKDWDMVSNIDEFLSYQNELNKIRKCMDNNLSPLEKVMFAYDYAKAHTFNQSGDASLNGLPHYTLNGEYIVCRGYVLMIQELLTNVENVSCSSTGWNVTDKEGNKVDGHARGIVKIDDDKYNIHGLYFLEPTSDSYKEQNKNYFGDEYSRMDLYRYFLKPLTDKEIYYDNNYNYRMEFLATDEELIKYGLEETFNYKQEEKIIEIMNMDKSKISLFLSDGIGNVFDKNDNISSYITTEQPDLSLILEAAYNVRIAMGYSIEDAKKECERIKQLNMEFFLKDTEQIAELMIQQMVTGQIDINGQSICPNQEIISNNRTMGFTKVWILGILTTIASIGIIVVGLLLSK